MWARASLFRRFADTNVYGTGSVKISKTRHKISVDIRIGITQCAIKAELDLLDRHRRYTYQIAFSTNTSIILKLQAMKLRSIRTLREAAEGWTLCVGSSVWLPPPPLDCIRAMEVKVSFSLRPTLPVDGWR